VPNMYNQKQTYRQRHTRSHIPVHMRIRVQQHSEDAKSHHGPQRCIDNTHHTQHADADHIGDHNEATQQVAPSSIGEERPRDRIVPNSSPRRVQQITCRGHKARGYIEPQQVQRRIEHTGCHRTHRYAHPSNSNHCDGWWHEEIASPNLGRVATVRSAYGSQEYNNKSMANQIDNAHEYNSRRHHRHQHAARE